jgi:hypothetical protein
LTYQGNPRDALEAVVSASRGAQPAARDTCPAPAHPAAPRARVAVDRAAVALLARVLAYRPAHGPPIVQLAACAPGENPVQVTAALAKACAVLVGRTLLVELDAESTGLFDAGSARQGPLPDAFLPGLYHFRIGTSAGDAELLYGPARAAAWASVASPFRILVMQAGNPASGATLAVAPLCCCTVLAVQAGRTPLAAIRNAHAALMAAGGRVVGTVLVGAGSR